MKPQALLVATVMSAFGLAALDSAPAAALILASEPTFVPPPQPPTSTPYYGPAPAPNLSRSVLDEINFMRTDPQGYIQVLRDYRTQFKGDIVVRPGRVNIQTYEGVAAVDEAIRFLQRQPPLPALRGDPVLARAAAHHVADQGPKGGFGHYGSDGWDFTVRISRLGGAPYGGEIISYGYDTAREVVVQLLVDDNVADRGHRTNMFRFEFVRAGSACGPHAVHGYMCVIDFGY